MKDYKKIFNCIVFTHIYICNLTLTSGCFPDKMNVAKVAPLFEYEENNVFTNYRPVSLLQQFFPKDFNDLSMKDYKKVFNCIVFTHTYIYVI